MHICIFQNVAKWKCLSCCFKKELEWKRKWWLKNSSVGCNIDLKIYSKQHGKNMRFVQSGVGFTPECVWNTAPCRDSFVWWHNDRNEICNDPCLYFLTTLISSLPLSASSPLTQEPMYYLYLNANFTALDLLPAAHENGFGLKCVLPVPREKNTAKTY